MNIFSEFKKLKESDKKFQEINDAIVEALYQPALNADALIGVDMTWVKEDNKNRRFNFVSSLEPLSRFYADINPPMSAAIWGIWNALQIDESFLDNKINHNKRRDQTKLIDAQALVATAAIQFADGTFADLPTLFARNKIDNYEKYALHTLNKLRSIK